jgi:GABA(A) receptor-associated protein
MSISFKQQYSFEKRFLEAGRILKLYPDRVPIVCEKNKKQELPTINKKKYLVPHEITISQFIHVIRKRLSLRPELSILVSIEGFVPASTMTIGELYNEHKHPDGFLYIEYFQENTFGMGEKG